MMNYERLIVPFLARHWIHSGNGEPVIAHRSQSAVTPDQPASVIERHCFMEVEDIMRPPTEEQRQKAQVKANEEKRPQYIVIDPGNRLEISRVCFSNDTLLAIVYPQ